MKKDRKQTEHKQSEPVAGSAEADDRSGESAAPASDNDRTTNGAGDALTIEIEGLKDRLLRLQADFDNFRKRTTRERSELFARANEDILFELLPVLDHFELGLKTASDHEADSAVMEGFRIVYDQLLAAGRKFGLQPVGAGEGDAFDPHQHEAISHVPSDTTASDCIIAEARRGYRLGDKLLRPAQVVVSSGQPASAETAEKDQRD